MLGEGHRSARAGAEALSDHPMERQKTTSRIRGTLMDVEVAAQNLRRHMTSAERLLWGAIRRQQADGLRFRRQHPVGRYVLDFYCPSHRLVIELDGGIHEQQIEMDAARTEHLARYGNRVIRFRNAEVCDALPSVVERIRQIARTIEHERHASAQCRRVTSSPASIQGRGTAG